jgi:HPt (histidine-containing phosphotransfer) domain-containing protein
MGHALPTCCDRAAAMTTANPAFLAFLEEQRADYRRSLPQRLAQIESLWRLVLNGEAPVEALASLERCAHGLAGSGATFGFAALGDAARALELIVNPLLDSAHALAPTEQADVSRAIESLRRSLAGESGIQGV